jgi:hypothetical protein
MSAVQIARSKARFADPVAADLFEAKLHRADALVYEAAQLRREAWAAYRAAILDTTQSADTVGGQYA